MKLRFKTTGMHCKSCEMLIKDSLEDEAGVNEVSSSFKDNIVIVDFDESKIGEDKIKAIIKKEGYGVK